MKKIINIAIVGLGQIGIYLYNEINIDALESTSNQLLKKLELLNDAGTLKLSKKTISSLKSANGLVVGSMLCKIITNSLKMRQNPVTKLDKVVYNLKNKIL